MKHIDVFVAGSKKLTTYREQLVLWANGKNYDYRSRKQNLQLNIYSFKEVGDDQDMYNAVITEKSDIILFIIEGSLGEKTKEELTKAQEGFNRKKRPEIWVFTNNAETDVITYLEGALGRKYAVDFNSAEDLVNKVNIRMDNYVGKLNNNEYETHKTENKAAVPKNWIKFAAICLVCLIAGLGIGTYCIKTNPAEEKVDRHMLLIAGGGSVANFIEEQKDTKIPSLADYPDGYFLHLPTKSAWKMLVEEVVSLQDTRRYYPVCISAAEATDDDFCNAQISKQMFLDSAIVLSCKLGEDPLAVYVPEKCKFLEDNTECSNSKRISVSQLKQLIESKEMNVYTTSLESGTRAGYCKILNMDNDELNEFLAGHFSEHSPISSVSKDNRPYLLLGSHCYQMYAVRNEVKRLTVDTEYVKPMIIYFMAYRISHDNYKIPEETIKFIHDLEVTSLDDYIFPDGTIKIKNHDHVIYKEADLIRNSK